MVVGGNGGFGWVDLVFRFVPFLSSLPLQALTAFVGIAFLPYPHHDLHRPTFSPSSLHSSLTVFVRALVISQLSPHSLHSIPSHDTTPRTVRFGHVTQTMQTYFILPTAVPTDKTSGLGSLQKLSFLFMDSLGPHETPNDSSLPLFCLWPTAPQVSIDITGLSIKLEAPV